MTRGEFRNHFLSLLEKAEKINENIEFVEISVHFSSHKDLRGKIMNSLSVQIKEYHKSVWSEAVVNISPVSEINEIHKRLDDILEEIEVA